MELRNDSARLRIGRNLSQQKSYAEHLLVELGDELVLQALLEVQHEEVHARLRHQVHEVLLLSGRKSRCEVKREQTEKS